MKVYTTLGLILIIFLLPSLVLDLLVISETDYIIYFSKRLPADILEDFVKESLEWKWLAYLITVLIIIFKTLIISCFIWLGIYLSNEKQSFQKIWKVTIVAQAIFAVKSYILMVKLIFTSDFNLDHLQTFHPLSLASLFDTENIPGYWSFLLQSLNLFEVAYWFFLAYFLSKELKSTFNDGLKIVVTSYIPAFVLWLVAVTFLLVSNS